MQLIGPAGTANFFSSLIRISTSPAATNLLLAPMETRPTQSQKLENNNP
jgi:hypothetical protein